MSILKASFFILLTVLTRPVEAQRDKKLVGAWVRTGAAWYNEGTDRQIAEYDRNYLKYVFTYKGEMFAHVNYFANSVALPATIQKGRIKLSLGRDFSIEKLNDNELVLVELYDGRPTSESKRYFFLKEHSYLDQLPLNKEDVIVNAEGDTVYMSSVKLYPQFSHKRHPDFHIYLHNQIKKAYASGENYFYATFEIATDGSIDNIQVLHHINQETETRAKAAIKNSEGMWSVPKLNGKDVTIVMSIEDRFTKTKRSADLSIERSMNSPGRRFSDAYANALHLVIRNYLIGKAAVALKNLAICERIAPDEPSLVYLRYLIYSQEGEEELAQVQHTKLKNGPLSYLVK